jgi:hypothetical protein
MHSEPLRRKSKVLRYVFGGFAMLIAGILLVGFNIRNESDVSVVAHNKGIALRFLGFTSGTNHVISYPSGAELKVRRILSNIGIEFEKQTFRSITPLPADQLWLILRVNETNQLMHPEQLRIETIRTNGVTNIKEFNLMRPFFTNNEVFGFGVRLPATPQESKGTRIEVVARSTNVFSRKYTNHLATIRVR